MHKYTSHRKKVHLGVCRRAPFRIEKINPSAKLNTFQIPLKPVESQMQPLDAARDQLPQGRTIHALLLTYKLSLETEGKHRVTVPMLNRYQFFRIAAFHQNKRLSVNQPNELSNGWLCYSVCLTT